MKPECLFPLERMKDIRGAYRTQSLFREYRFISPDGKVYMYNLTESDLDDSKSMYKIYMECSSEYEAAYKLLGSWKHWQKLCNCAWFKEHIDTWKEEKEIRDQAIAKATLLKAAAEGNVNAAKIIVDGDTKKRGRPSKTEINREARAQAELLGKVELMSDRLKTARDN